VSAELKDQVCVVTGASSGIGRAIALAFASAGATVCAVARRRDALQETADAAQGPGEIVLCHADLTREADLANLSRELTQRGVDVLVHSAGRWAHGSFETAPVEELDRQFAANVRAPYVLTQALLPVLRERKGQVVFVNSSAGLTARAGVAQYAAGKHALKALADALREEVNPAGVRVVSVYPGRTATPMQETVFAVEERAYVPERLLQPVDVASVVLQAVTMPRTGEVTDLVIRPMQKG